MIATAEILLPEMLGIAVPIWQCRLKAAGGPTEETWERCRTFADELVGPGGEDLLFRGKQTARLFNDLAYTLAVMSFAPGGITLFGYHWETGPAQSMDANNGCEPTA